MFALHTPFRTSYELRINSHVWTLHSFAPPHNWIALLVRDAEALPSQFGPLISSARPARFALEVSFKDPYWFIA